MGGLFSIGHSNHEWSKFAGLLEKHQIEVLADVRSYPASRYVPIYNRENLEAALRQCGIKYLFLGKELGGRPANDEMFDAQGHVLYGRLARTKDFLEGIARLEECAWQQRVAMMCSEEDPLQCHRHLLVGRVLHERGVGIRHIRGAGQLEAEADLRAGAIQPFLFTELEDMEWRSLKPLKDKARFQEEDT